MGNTGIPNTQLVQSKNPMAVVYKNRCVAEQKSVAIAFDLLLDRRFKELRETIYHEHAELVQFRSVVVNAVLATDHLASLLAEQRAQRWSTLFGQLETGKRLGTVSCRATLVIELMIHGNRQQRWSGPF